jgi:pyruvate-formate lyase-activating enzyme
MNTNSLAIAIVTSLGPTIAIIVSAILARRGTERVASTLKVNTTQTQTKLADLKKVADTTHTIVNNQRTVMLRFIAELTHRIAKENPKDNQAQEAASLAKEEAKNASNAPPASG